MSSSPIALFASVVMLSSAALGCAPQACPSVASAAAPATTTSAAAPQRLPPPGERHVYRFDFVLTAVDGSSAPSSTAFTLNLEEAEKGEVVVGRNVALSSATSPGSGPPPAVARQDVGIKVAAMFRTAGDDVVLDVSTEMSTFEPPTSIRKMVAKGNALAATGKPALVTTLEDDHKKYQLTVTPTKLR